MCSSDLQSRVPGIARHRNLSHLHPELPGSLSGENGQVDGLMIKLVRPHRFQSAVTVDASRFDIDQVVYHVAVVPGIHIAANDRIRLDPPLVGYIDISLRDHVPADTCLPTFRRGVVTSRFVEASDVRDAGRAISGWVGGWCPAKVQ